MLARDGAHVIGVDVPAQARRARQVAGAARRLLAARRHHRSHDAPAPIASHLLEKHGGVDVVVHNAGVTRDKTLARMSEEQWDLLMEINLIAPQRIDAELFAREACPPKRAGGVRLLDQRDRWQRRARPTTRPRRPA